MFHHSSSSHTNHTCPVQSLAQDAAKPIFGDTTFYELSRIIAGACAAFATVVITFVMFMHATHYSKPNEQAKIMRIAILIPTYAVGSLIFVCVPTTAVYLDPWLDFVQSIALGSFFLLMCEFVSPNAQHRNLFFAGLQVPSKKSKTGTKDGLSWFRIKWILIFQYPIVALICSIATDITQAAGIYCQFSSKLVFAHFWIGLVLNISIIAAVLSVVNFYMVLKKLLARHKPLAKLLAFKLVVFLTFAQGIIFWILRSVSVLQPNDELTYADVYSGIPALVICLEMVPLSLFFCYAYSWGPYVVQGPGFTSAADRDTPHQYVGGFLGIKAWCQMWDLREIFSAIAFAFRMAQKKDAGQQMGGDAYHQGPALYAPAANRQ